MMQYFHIGLSVPPEVDVQSVQNAIDARCQDWLRYAPNCYIVWTDLVSANLAGVLMSVPGMDKGHFLVVKIDMTDGFGWVSPWIWEWIRRNRQTQEIPGIGPMLIKPPSVD